MDDLDESNFRVEMWDRDETKLLLTLSRSPDQFVSQAAWNEAVRRYPDKLLVHYNARWIMQRNRVGIPERPLPGVGRRTRQMKPGGRIPSASVICPNGTASARCVRNAAIVDG